MKVRRALWHRTKACGKVRREWYEDIMIWLGGGGNYRPQFRTLELDARKRTVTCAIAGRDVAGPR
jgi:hypothetical protein